MSAKTKEYRGSWGLIASDNKLKLLLWGAILAVIGLLIVNVVTYSVRIYQSALLLSNQNQLTNISESVANSIKIYLEEYQQTAQTITQLEQFRVAETELDHGSREKMQELLDQQMEIRGKEVACLRYVNETGTLVESGEDTIFRLHRSMGVGGDMQETAIVKDMNNNFYFSISAKAKEQGGTIFLFLSMKTVYDKTASYIQMGENGYVMIKDSEGIILMHPVEQQVGLDVLEGRKEIYPNYDFSSLENLIRHQLEEKSGVEIYTSYWWADDPPTPTKKISAYLPVEIGSDFLSVSAVIDYSEIADPVQEVALRIMLMVIVVMAFVFFMIYLLLRSLRQGSIIARENSRLIKINEDLEKLRKQEEVLAQQQRLQLIGTMTSGVAHEFNNLLTPIMGYSTMILAGMTEDDEDYEDMKEIQSSAEKAKEIINSLSQFSRKNAELMQDKIHIAAPIKKALVITDAVKKREIELVSQVETERDVCLGNEVQLYQILVNLCNNALHAMSEKGGKLTVIGQAIQPLERREDFFKGKAHKWFYRISIKDTGCGMSQETISQIFVPFFTTKKPGEGTGLGLAIVSRLIEAHQGLITVKSKEGEGTEFEIFLPLVEDKTEA